MLPKISRNKSNQTIKLCQLIEYNKGNFHSRITHVMRQGDQIQTSFYFFKNVEYEVKTTILQLIFSVFRQLSNWDNIRTNCIKLQIIDPEICSILIFQKRIQDQFIHQILCIIFQETFCTCYILLMIKFHCLMTITSGDIGQQLYYNQLLTRL